MCRAIKARIDVNSGITVIHIYIHTFYIYIEKRHLYLLYINHLCYGGANDDEEIGRAIIKSYTKLETSHYVVRLFIVLRYRSRIVLVYIPLTFVSFTLLLLA